MGDDSTGHEPVLHRDDLESLLSEVMCHWAWIYALCAPIAPCQLAVRHIWGTLNLAGMGTSAITAPTAAPHGGAGLEVR